MKKLFALFVCLIAIPAGAVELTAEDLNAWLDGYLPYALRTGDIAGAEIAVVKDGKILTERGYGFSDVHKRTPVDPQTTLFRVGSVSKLCTWTAVMQLVEQGRLDLDTDINRYLDFKIPDRAGKPITLRNLMQHAAGFEEQGKGVITEDPKTPGFEVLLKRWVPERVFDSGTTQAYSNYGASLAGYIVQRVSGEPFDTYIEKHIFEPLDMTHSSFRRPLPPQLVPLVSKGYKLASGEAARDEIVGPAPAGALAATADDIARFMIAHLRNGEYNGKRILLEATARQMHDSPLTLLPPLNRMELGFFETNINGREVIAHLGDTRNFHTSLHLFLQEGVGFYVSFNSLGKQGAAGGLRTALFADFADRYLPEREPQPLVDARTSAEHAASLSGSWVSSRGSRSNFASVLDLAGEIQLGRDAMGSLLAPFRGLNGMPRHWVEVAPYVWRDLNSHERLAAKVVDGKAVRFSIDLLSPFMVYERPPWYRNSTWLRPVFLISMGALLLTVVLWPVTAITRRKFSASLALSVPQRRAYRLSKMGATVIVAGVAAWIALLSGLPAVSDRLLRGVEAFGIVAFLGGFVCMLLNLPLAWSDNRRWPAKTWSVVLTLSAFFVLWVAFVFNLMSFGVNY